MKITVWIKQFLPHEQSVLGKNSAERKHLKLQSPAAVWVSQTWIFRYASWSPFDQKCHVLLLPQSLPLFWLEGDVCTQEVAWRTTSAVQKRCFSHRWHEGLATCERRSCVSEAQLSCIFPDEPRSQKYTVVFTWGSTSLELCARKRPTSVFVHAFFSSCVKVEKKEEKVSICCSYKVPPAGCLQSGHNVNIDVISDPENPI